MTPARVHWNGDAALALPRWSGAAAPARLDRREAACVVGALLFDLGGTLDADGLGWGERFSALLRAELPGAPGAAIAESIVAGEKAVLRHPRADTLGLEDMVALHVETQLTRLGDRSPARAARLAKVFYEETSHALASRRPLLHRLAQRIPLGVVSNGCGNSERLLRDAGLASLFRVVVDSSAAGAWKPDPRIFAPALAALGLPPAQVAMVGDRLDRDVEGAAAAGLRTVWISGGRRLDASDPLAAAVDVVLGSVAELDPEPVS